MSFVSLTLGSVTQQRLREEINDEFGIVEKASVAPFFLVVCITKVWILTELMWTLHEVNWYLTLIPVIALGAIQLTLHLVMKVEWQESVFSMVGNLTTVRRPEASHKTCLKLFKVEAITSAVTYCLMTVLSLSLRNSGPLDGAKTMPRKFISLGLLVIYVLVSQSYLWLQCLWNVLFSKETADATSGLPEPPLDTIELRSVNNSGAIQEESLNRRIYDNMENGHQLREARRGHTKRHRSQISSTWLAIPIIAALVIQFSLVAYFGYVSGRKTLVSDK